MGGVGRCGARETSCPYECASYGSLGEVVVRVEGDVRVPGTGTRMYECLAPVHGCASAWHRYKQPQCTPEKMYDCLAPVRGTGSRQRRCTSAWHRYGEMYERLVCAHHSWCGRHVGEDGRAPKISSPPWYEAFGRQGMKTFMLLLMS